MTLRNHYSSIVWFSKSYFSEVLKMYLKNINIFMNYIYEISHIWPFKNVKIEVWHARFKMHFFKKNANLCVSKFWKLFSVVFSSYMKPEMTRFIVSVVCAKKVIFAFITWCDFEDLHFYMRCIFVRYVYCNLNLDFDVALYLR